MWKGDNTFLLKSLVFKDFRIRYRNMSLGVAWSLLNPLAMMLVLTFIFTKIVPGGIPQFPVFVLCGLVPFNFFAIAWATATSSITDNIGLIKYVGIPRQAVPIGAVLANCIHLGIQIALLLIIAVGHGILPNRHWVWLPVVWILEIGFVCGLGLLFSALNVYIRDTRYVVESSTVVLWWLVPIIYDFSVIPQQYKDIYQYNPVAALVLAMRTIILEEKTPPDTLLIKLFCVSLLMLGIGYGVFSKLQKQFYNHL